MQELRDYVGRAVLEAYVVNRNDVGVVQRGGGSRFLVEAPHMVWIGTRRGANELEGYIPAQSFVTRTKDLTHPSFTNFF
jgi:hypothetical protein